MHRRQRRIATADERVKRQRVDVEKNCSSPADTIGDDRPIDMSRLSDR